MHGRGRHVSATGSGVHSIYALVGSILFNVLFLELVKLCVTGLFKDLHIELRPVTSSSETIKLLHKLCTA